jgi:cell division septation protein DedD
LLVYGTALFNGDNVTQDPILGYAYISRAAAQGLAPAKETLVQLDKILPLDDRKKAVALAMAKAKAAPPPGSNAAKAKPRPTPVAATKPAPKQAATPLAAKVAATPATGNWRIQLGAFSRRGSAEALYKAISGNGALAGRQAYYVPAGAVTRLQVGPFASRIAAQVACNALKQACFPVPAK